MALGEAVEATSTNESSNKTIRELTLRVDTLEKENAALKQELNKKRASPASSGQPKKKAKTPGQRKKIFEKWVKALKRESAKTKIVNGYGGEIFRVVIKETALWSREEFAEFFDGHPGTKIQPTADNKPTSTITILEMKNMEQIKKLFGDCEISDAGYHVKAMSRRSFSKSYRTGDWECFVDHLQIHYNKSKQSLQLNFFMSTSEEGFY